MDRRNVDIHDCPSMIVRAGLAEDEREVVGVMQAMGSGFALCVGRITATSDN